MSSASIPDHSAWRWLLAAALVAVAALHVAALGSLPEFHGRLPWRIDWPHTLHLWIVELVAVLVALASLIGSAIGARVRKWLSQQTPVRRAFALGALLLSVETALAGGYWLTWPHGIESLGWLRAIFYLGGEFTPAAFFSTFQFWLCAWFAWKLFVSTSQRPWLLGVALCAYLGLDELISIHELVGRAGYDRSEINSLLDGLGSMGIPLYSWQIIFFPIASGVGLVCIRCFAGLVSSRELGMLVLAGVVFLTGALGFEVIEARAAKLDPVWWAGPGGHLNLLIEETLEMVGVTIAVAVLAQRHGRLAGTDLPTMGRPRDRRSCAGRTIAGNTGIGA